MSENLKKFLDLIASNKELEAKALACNELGKEKGKVLGMVAPEGTRTHHDMRLVCVLMDDVAKGSNGPKRPSPLPLHKGGE